MDFQHSIEINNTQFMQINYKFGRYLLKYLINLKMFVPPEKVKCGSFQVLRIQPVSLKTIWQCESKTTEQTKRDNENEHEKWDTIDQ